MIELLLKGQGLLIAGLSLILGAAAMVFRAHVLDLVSDRAPRATVAALGERVDGIETRLTGAETTMRHLPSAKQVNALNISMTELRGEMRTMAAQLDGVGAMLTAQGRKVELIDEHLRRGPA